MSSYPMTRKFSPSARQKYLSKRIQRRQISLRRQVQTRLEVRGIYHAGLIDSEAPEGLAGSFCHILQLTYITYLYLLFSDRPSCELYCGLLRPTHSDQKGESRRFARFESPHRHYLPKRSPRCQLHSRGRWYMENLPAIVGPRLLGDTAQVMHK